MTTIITPQDRLWLCDKLGLPRITAADFVVAMIHGNEDAPAKVELFKRDHYRCNPTTYISNEDGALVYNEAASYNAGKLRPRTAAEKEKGCL